MKRSRIVIESDLPVTVRDGTKLRADVYRPDAPGRFPVALTRTPYNKELLEDVAIRLAQRGNVVVMQDVRGRFASDGDFRPGFYSAITDDAADGYDTVEWAAALPWSSGKVCTFGNSYAGWTQWELAHSKPPSLTAIMPSGVAASLLDREMCGVLRLGRVLWWTINTLAPEARRRSGSPTGPFTQDEAVRLWADRDRAKWLWYLPLTEIPTDMLSSMAVHFGNWMAHHTKDNFGFLEKHRQIAVPALSVTGWYDQQIGTIRQFTGMVENGMTEHARSNQHLIIGPWGHTLHMTDDWDWIDFGPDTSLDFVEMADLWLKRWSTGEPNQVDDWPPIRLFVMGANHWRNEQEWPLARTVYTDFFLSSNGSANTATGDGKLSREHPHDEPNDRFRYDPRDPVMTLYTPEGQHAPFDQRPLDARGDILNYTTAPLEEPLETTGPVVVTLWASSSALDTDFVAKLTDVWPDGFVQELCYGIVRARYRDSLDAPSLLEPGRPYEFTINLNPTSNLFKAGHRIRLAISSSDFPSFDRNHNTGGDDYADPLLLTAEQTVFHDSSRPSKIVLPVIR